MVFCVSDTFLFEKVLAVSHRKKKAPQEKSTLAKAYSRRLQDPHLRKKYTFQMTVRWNNAMI